MISLEKITQNVSHIASEYSLKRVELFGSLANDKATEESDIDLLVEFNQPQVSLIVLRVSLISDVDEMEMKNFRLF